jgi:LmbE family N-acetylglucosaminyl deacetylase
MQHLSPDALQESDLLPYQTATELPGQRIIILAPHADDEVFGCGGAIMRYIEQGADVRVIIATDGAANHNSELSRQAYISQRQAESREAARILGYGEAAFWGLADRSLMEALPVLQARLQEMLNDFHADCLFAPSLHEIHPDHYACALAALHIAQHDCRTLRRIVFYEVGIACRPNLLLDITPFKAKKQAAMRCFRSQLGLQAYAEQISALNRYRTYTLAHVELAEAYYSVDTASLRDNTMCAYGQDRQTRAMQALHEHFDEQLNAQQQACKQREADLLREIEALHAKIAELYASTSWQVSRPLRAIKYAWYWLRRR